MMKRERKSRLKETGTLDFSDDMGKTVSANLGRLAEGIWKTYITHDDLTDEQREQNEILTLTHWRVDHAVAKLLGIPVSEVGYDLEKTLVIQEELRKQLEDDGQGARLTMREFEQFYSSAKDSLLGKEEKRRLLSNNRTAMQILQKMDDLLVEFLLETDSKDAGEDFKRLSNVRLFRSLLSPKSLRDSRIQEELLDELVMKKAESLTEDPAASSVNDDPVPNWMINLLKIAVDAIEKGARPVSKEHCTLSVGEEHIRTWFFVKPWYFSEWIKIILTDDARAEQMNLPPLSRCDEEILKIPDHFQEAYYVRWFKQRSSWTTAEAAALLIGREPLDFPDMKNIEQPLLGLIESAIPHKLIPLEDSNPVRIDPHTVLAWSSEKALKLSPKLTSRIHTTEESCQQPSSLELDTPVEHPEVDYHLTLGTGQAEILDLIPIHEENNKAFIMAKAIALELGLQEDYVRKQIGRIRKRGFEILHARQRGYYRTKAN